MKRFIKDICIILILFFSMLGVVGTASASNNYNWTPEQFLNNISSIDDGDTVTISNGTANVSQIHTINASNVLIKANGTVIFKGNVTTNTYFNVTGNNITLEGITFTNLSNDNQDQFGGAISWFGGDGVIRGCTFNNNHAINGGAISWSYSNNAIVEYCNFLNNSASTDGGAIYMSADIIFCIKYCNFTNNQANIGGAIYCSADNCSVDYCNFTGNIANSGAGLSCVSGIGHVDYCNFFNNFAKVEGGAISWFSKNGTIKHCNFTNNTATKFGGAIFLNIVFNTTVSDCNFTDNSAINGGAVYMTSSPNVNVVNCDFANNSANTDLGLFILDGNAYKTNNVKLINDRFNNSKFTRTVKPNVINDNTQNLTVIGCENALISFIGDSASINSNVSVIILNNESVRTEQNKEINLTAVIMADGVNNTLIGLPFNFTINDINYKGELNGTNYILSYIPPTWGIFTVNGTCRNVNADNITFRTGTLIVLKSASVNLTIDKSIASYGESITLNITAIDENNKALNGTVAIIADGKTYKNINLTNGSLIYALTSLDADEHKIKIRFINEEYMGESNASMVNITQITPEVDMVANDTTYGQNISLIVYVTGMNSSFVLGNVTIKVDDNIFKEDILLINGVASCNLTDLSVGKHTITAIYNGNKNYTDKTKSKNISIEKADTKITIDIKTDINTAIIYLNLTDFNGKPINGKLEVNVLASNGYEKVENVIIVNGTGILTINYLSNGYYNVTANFIATLNYTASSNNDSFEISYTPTGYCLNATNVVKYFQNGTQYHVTLTDNYGTLLSNQTIIISLSSSKWANSKSYNIVTNASGVATLDINLIAGKYSIVAIFMNATPEVNNITVLEVNYVLTANDIIKYYCNGTEYIVKVTSQFGYVIDNEAVTVKVYSTKWLKPAAYTIKTNSSGVAKLDINLIAGIYTISSTVGKTTKYNNIAVYPTLTAESITKKVNKEADLKAKVVDGQGNPAANKIVKFTVKTKTYYLTTDSNGIATLPIHLGLGTWSFLIDSGNAQTRATVKVIK